MLFCCTLLALPCFSLRRYGEYAPGKERWVLWTENVCPSVKFIKNRTGYERPLGCKCGGREQFLPEWTLCYVDLNNWQEWIQPKDGLGYYRCPLGKCNRTGYCTSIKQYEECMMEFRPK
uniref:Putative secreted protein n=1 Tax=Amblyomma parvum TaxID=251391 RepID=A0A023G2N1_AMBPA